MNTFIASCQLHCTSILKLDSHLHILLLSYRSGTPRAGDIDSRVGNSNDTGKWFFRLERSGGEQDGVLKCIRWFKQQVDPRRFTDRLQACPCGIRQAFFDERFQYDPSGSADRYCVYTRFPSVANRGRQCCYNTSWPSDSWGALIVGSGGGAIDNYHKLTEHLKEQHEANDVNGFQYCCVASRMCHRFYESRPSEGCERYQVPVWSKFDASASKICRRIRIVREFKQR